MVAEEVYVNCYNFNPIRERHASIRIKSKVLLLISKKVIFKVPILSEAWPELQNHFAALQHWRISYSMAIGKKHG
jgi:hypothetical protein